MPFYGIQTREGWPLRHKPPRDFEEKCSSTGTFVSRNAAKIAIARALASI